jgi:hypothetical protein
MTSVKMDFDELSVRISTITDAVINAERMHKHVLDICLPLSFANIRELKIAIGVFVNTDVSSSSGDGIKNCVFVSLCWSSTHRTKQKFFKVFCFLRRAL